MYLHAAIFCLAGIVKRSLFCVSVFFFLSCGSRWNATVCDFYATKVRGVALMGHTWAVLSSTETIFLTPKFSSPNKIETQEQRESHCKWRDNVNRDKHMNQLCTHSSEHLRWIDVIIFFEFMNVCNAHLGVIFKLHALSTVPPSIRLNIMWVVPPCNGVINNHIVAALSFIRL